MKHAGGRPTKYEPEILKKTKDYLLNYKALGDEVPTIAGLAVELSISRETIYDWISQEEKKKFSDIVRDLMSQQERSLFNGGLSGKFNPSITKLALTKHGYTDKADVTSDGKAIIQFDNAFASKTEGNS